jgi:hypothetical protein
MRVSAVPKREYNTLIYYHHFIYFEAVVGQQKIGHSTRDRIFEKKYKQ